MTYIPRIAIIGAGPAGLTLGALLHKRGIKFTIYELRQCPSDQELAQPSGMLDLHEESGLAAIRACDLWEEFQPASLECSETMIVCDKDSNVRHMDDGHGEYRPEISRHALIRMLLSKVPANAVRWGTKLLSATRNASNPAEVTLDLGPSGTETFDLVIGADGAWSRIRPLLSAERPHYSGLQYITLNITHITERHPDLEKFVGKGSLFALGTRNAIISHRSELDSSHLYLAISADEEHMVELGDLTLSELKDRLLEDPKLYGQWSGKTRELIVAACDDEATRGRQVDIKALSMLPIGHRWESQPGATMIGDSAHLMTPFAGEGVNLAMWDALDMAESVGKALQGSQGTATSFQTTVADLLRSFEENMFARAEARAQETWRNRQLMFTETGAKDLGDLMESFAAQATQQA